MSEPLYLIEEWTEKHARWPEFLQCLQETAPEQVPFVLGDYARHLPCYLLVALQNNRVAGFLRFGIQPIGAEAGCPPLDLNSQILTEAKIHAFAVQAEYRNQGIGRALQKKAIKRSKELGCYQLASHTSYNNPANHHVKLSLGFSVLPEAHGDQMNLIFLMPLQVSIP